jgi:hypothetical protein
MSGRKVRAFVDRIEGEMAVLLLGENEDTEVVLPASFLPEGGGEGAVLIVELRFDPEETARACHDLTRLMDELDS